MLDIHLYKEIVDAMSAHVAILDQQGTIVETNLSWQKFAQENDLKGPSDSIGVNYLEVCDASNKHDCEDASLVAGAIRKVLSGTEQDFLTRYPCHSPESKRWFAVRVIPIKKEGPIRVIVSHENITPIMEKKQELRKQQTELLAERQRLEEANTALHVLVGQRNDDIKRTQESVHANIHRLVLPYLEDLMQGGLSERQQTLTKVISKNIRDIISPFLSRINSLGLLLSAPEIEVANMVRGGRSSKEIAAVMGISVSGVDFHRKRLRQKLGLVHSDKNLRSYLLSLEDER